MRASWRGPSQTRLELHHSDLLNIVVISGPYNKIADLISVSQREKITIRGSVMTSQSNTNETFSQCWHNVGMVDHHHTSIRSMSCGSWDTVVGCACTNFSSFLSTLYKCHVIVKNTLNHQKHFAVIVSNLYSFHNFCCEPHLYPTLRITIIMFPFYIIHLKNIFLKYVS